MVLNTMHDNCVHDVNKTITVIERTV